MKSATNGSRHEMERQLAPTTDTLNEARLAVGKWASKHPLFQTRLADIELVVSELASNAIAASDGEPYEVSGRVHGQELRVSVSNSAPLSTPPPPSKWGPEDVLAPSGRGLSIVRGIADHVTVTRDGGIVCVTATFRARS